MIVERGHVGLIVSGRRTQTRKLVDQREPGYRVRTGRRGLSHSLQKPWVPKVGVRLPIQTAGEKAELYVVVTGVRTEPAGATTREDAQACGHGTLTAWKAAWVREHAKEWVARERDRQALRAAAADVGIDLGEAYVRRLVAEHGSYAAEVFRKVEREQAVASLHAMNAAGGRPDATVRDPEAPPILPTLTAAQLAARFDTHHADQPVWVIDHAVATDEPYNLLAARPGSAGEDYVRSPTAAMGGDLDPGEAVDGETIERLGQQAQLRQQQGVVADWLALRRTLEQQIRALETAHDLTPKQVQQLQRFRRQLEGGDKRFLAA